ncbi:MAG: hypothetical protein JRN45_00575 [Nitrososphaerota archaeon]|nr:hypothetical protein [Nitrososphaerota archaeon]
MSEELEEGLDALKERMKHPVLKEFADYLVVDEKYSVGDIEALLLLPWDGAYPQGILGDDVLVDIGNFLYSMGDFAVEKVIKDDFQKIGGRQLYVKTVPDPSYEDSSHVYVIESTTRTLLAEGCGCKTWHHDPDTIAFDLLSLEGQLESGWELVQKRVLALNLLGSPTDLPLRNGTR